MSKLKTYIILIAIGIFFNSCFGLFDSDFDTIVGVYNVGWIDIVSSRSIDMASKKGEHGGVPIVPPYIFSVGHNKKFIIAKQHPLVSIEQIDTKKTNYFVIDMTDNYYNQEGVYGPLTKIKFDSLIAKLKVGKIEFDMTYPDQP